MQSLALDVKISILKVAAWPAGRIRESGVRVVGNLELLSLAPRSPAPARCR
ncbi:hypothetical protein [Streptomyces sp. TRM68367]|uniref:hypothetical protein n=1 Tax=Streptomyces sp. TRM68367 TaxID=2758415 RepID=UPI00165B4688|nr:hypothetical protein [Streptomyces sp. TRM68367]MBC9724420.1 hypothetical protein [Streptomyces sp. TRM68367]